MCVFRISLLLLLVFKNEKAKNRRLYVITAQAIAIETKIVKQKDFISVQDGRVYV